jgi:branched-chain amino acid transport system substrate-binding protein
VVDYAAQKGRANFAALVPQNPYGVAISGTLKQELHRQALAAPQIVSVGGGVEAMRAAVQKLSSTPDQKFDTLMLPLGGDQLTQAAITLRQFDVNLAQTKLIGTGLWDDAQSGQNGQGSLLQGGWYAAPDPKLRADFEKRYKQTFGQTAPRLASLGYDATALATVLASTQTGFSGLGSTPFSKTALLNPSGFAGIDGIFRFRPDGLIDRGLAVLEMRGNQAVVIDPAPKRF